MSEFLLTDVAPQLASRMQLGRNPIANLFCPAAHEDQAELWSPLAEPGEHRQYPIDPLPGLGQVAHEEQLRRPHQGAGAKILEMAPVGQENAVPSLPSLILQFAALPGRDADDHVGPLEDASVNRLRIRGLNRGHWDGPQWLVVGRVAQDG